MKKKLKRIRKLKDYRIHSEGNSILVVSFIVAVLINAPLWYFLPDLYILNSVVSVFSLVLYLLIVNFFRSPKRIFPGDVENVVVAPADGKVVVVEKVFEPDHFKDERIQVSIFMSPLNVHANWYPVDGVVVRSEHQKGKFHKAWLPKASTENERSLVVIKMEDGREILVRQIAGAMARRIVTYAAAGEECFIDQHMGFIKFGSRVDLYLPLDADIKVSLDQKTVGNETVIAKLK
ncbi:MAG: phosphatidylserine decarboxylase family protein [Bacteroidaceae bacterium]|jgi:phosphatidylserine decarboxylase|nr:phosphatidylserine decarboxylase family protein [Bacteroidaceae bacterium]